MNGRRFLSVQGVAGGFIVGIGERDESQGISSSAIFDRAELIEAGETIFRAAGVAPRPPASVWLLLGAPHYEDGEAIEHDTVLGVYASEESAKNAIKEWEDWGYNAYVNESVVKQ